MSHNRLMQIPWELHQATKRCSEDRSTGQAGRGGDGHCRCSCGNLLARLTEHGVEIKCKRCKRLVLFRWEEESRLGNPAQRH